MGNLRCINILFFQILYVELMKIFCLVKTMDLEEAEFYQVLSSAVQSVVLQVLLEVAG